MMLLQDMGYRGWDWFFWSIVEVRQDSLLEYVCCFMTAVMNIELLITLIYHVGSESSAI